MLPDGRVVCAPEGASSTLVFDPEGGTWEQIGKFGRDEDHGASVQVACAGERPTRRVLIHRTARLRERKGRSSGGANGPQRSALGG